MVKPFKRLMALCATATVAAALGLVVVPQAGAASPGHVHIDCASASGMCTEVAASDDVFGHYVGHDEPSMLFDSTTPGSGNHMRYDLTLPTEPAAADPTAPGKSYDFELAGADWLGMALCDTQSFPEQVNTCPPDSDQNILDPAVSPKHVGEAYMEMQFYPPGWVPWPTWQVAVGASSCDATHWCAALNVDSLSLNPVTGRANNPTCLNEVGEEYLNFAFITKNGRSQAPANPVDSTAATFTPDASRDLFMNSGDHLQVSFTDTLHGVRVAIVDLTTGQQGSMTASALNGFAQIGYDPTGTSCQAIPYDFHPMYSTSTHQTRVTWAAGSYNVAMDTEIGHFQTCTGPISIEATPFGLDSAGNPTECPSGDMEGTAFGMQPPDEDDYYCFPGSEALLYDVSGCTYTNTGFDGVSYQRVWPDGNTALHPSPLRFSSPTTGQDYTTPYPTAAFETDLPAIEGKPCNTHSGVQCTLIPTTDNGTPAAFYPFYSTAPTSSGCVWEFGDAIPGSNTYGENAQYGNLYAQTYTLKGGGSQAFFEDFRNDITNPCPRG